MEDNRRITPRDYLELALRPVQGGIRDVAAKNEVNNLGLIFFMINRWCERNDLDYNFIFVTLHAVCVIHVKCMF